MKLAAARQNLLEERIIVRCCKDQVLKRQSAVQSKKDKDLSRLSENDGEPCNDGVRMATKNAKWGSWIPADVQVQNPYTKVERELEKCNPGVDFVEREMRVEYPNDQGFRQAWKKVEANLGYVDEYMYEAPDVESTLDEDNNMSW